MDFIPKSMGSHWKIEPLYILRSLLSVENDYRRVRVEMKAIEVVQVKDNGGINQAGGGAGKESPQLRSFTVNSSGRASWISH